MKSDKESAAVHSEHSLLVTWPDDASAYGKAVEGRRAKSASGGLAITSGCD
ncbi:MULTISPECIES: hypothetical protein [unclassified Bradyrhizobium]|uniref:hypothetical protein n=1 Tax=unclassified Bradyrhizobium TaxID=2631580 RepID=UPI0028E7C42A|nr:MULTISPECIES: hypothetical protein [unclassified Bradyrhizobium]